MSVTSSREAEPLDLPHRLHLRAKLRSQQRQEEGAQPSVGIGDVTETEAGVDQREPPVALD